MKFSRFAPVVLAVTTLLAACQGSDQPTLDEDTNGEPSGGSGSSPRPTYSPMSLNITSATLITIKPNDPDSSTGFTYTLVDEADHGDVSVDSATGRALYKPDAGYSGSDAFTVQVADTEGNKGKIQVQINVEALSACTQLNPTFAPSNIRLAGTRPYTITITPSTDPNCTGFSYQITSNPGLGMAKLEGQTGKVTYTPSGVAGRDTFVVGITAQGGATGNATVSVTNGTNQLPTLTVSKPSWDATRKTASANASIADADMNDSHTLSIATQPMLGKATVDNTTRKLSYTPNAGATGTDSLVLRVTDANGGTANANVSFDLGGQANGAPAPTAQPNPASVIAGKSVNVTIAANDPNVGDTLSYTVSKVPAKGSVVFDVTKPNVAIYASNGLSGADSFEITVFDQVGASGKVTVNVNVTAGNNAPKPTATPSTFTATGATPVTLQIKANDPDLGDTHIYQVTQQPTKGKVTVSNQGAATYTANTGATGSDSFAVTVTDTGGLSGTVIVTGTLQSSTEGNAVAGEALFDDKCLGCHVAASATTRKASSVANLRSAINSVAAMKGLKTLTDSQLADIVAYIKSAN